jgi:hypothetical protein
MDLNDRFLRMNPWTSLCGSIIVGGLLGYLLGNATSSDYSQVARSVCFIQDETRDVCKTWASYNLHKVPNDQLDISAGHITRCLNAGGSLDHVAIMNDGGWSFTCVYQS